MHNEICSFSCYSTNTQIDHNEHTTQKKAHMFSSFSLLYISNDGDDDDINLFLGRLHVCIFFDFNLYHIIISIVSLAKK
jgi:hypothetical protein